MFNVFETAWRNRTLIWRLTRREVESRYRGSLLGLAWAVIVPLMMIAIYTFVFSTIMRARWAAPGAEPMPAEYGFGILLFAGFVIFAIFAEPVNRAAGLILENVSYVKKMVFPLEALPWVSVASGLVNAAISFLAFLVLLIAFYGLPPVTILALPLIVLPVVLFALGTTYILSSLGVFIRDIRQFVPLLTTAMLFLSPVVYPLEIVPEGFRPLVLANPLTIGIVQARQVIFWGEMPDLAEWGVYFAASMIVALLGYAWFQRTKKGFADVL